MKNHCSKILLHLKNMLGPCLAALEDWLLKPSRVNSNISSLDPFAGEDEDLQRSLPLSSWSGGLLNFFGVGSQDSSEKDTLLADSSSAASSCTGIFIHMFLDSSQVLILKSKHKSYFILYYKQLRILLKERTVVSRRISLRKTSKRHLVED